MSYKDLITIEPGKRGGKPCIHGLRITVYDVLEYLASGMTEDQIAELASDALFSVESHTADHPFLTYCTSAEADEQISQNRLWIEKITGRMATVIAYPSGDYDERILDICSRLGFQHGFAVIPRKLNRLAFEVPRVGVFSTSLNALAVKARYGHLIRRLGLRVG